MLGLGVVQDRRNMQEQKAEQKTSTMQDWWIVLFPSILRMLVELASPRLTSPIHAITMLTHQDCDGHGGTNRS